MKISSRKAKGRRLQNHLRDKLINDIEKKLLLLESKLNLKERRLSFAQKLL